MEGILHSDLIQMLLQLTEPFQNMTPPAQGLRGHLQALGPQMIPKTNKQANTPNKNASCSSKIFVSSKPT